MKIKKLVAATALATASLAGGQALALPFAADIIAIVDESGSMSGEHAWIGGMAIALNAGLEGLLPVGLTPNNFGLVGFGNGQGGSFSMNNLGRQIDVGGAQFGTAAQFNTASGDLVLSGGFEDGYSGINFANGYTFRAGAARNYILVTDEDRDNGNNALTYNSILTSMTGTNTLLNAVVNATFRCGDQSVALGIGQNGVGFVADGFGGYTTCAGATAFSGFGTTIADYVNLALATGGAAWDLNLLRAGGDTAVSFTNAFVDVKVQEIQEQNGVPEPGILALLGLGLLSLGFMRRKAA